MPDDSIDYRSPDAQEPLKRRPPGRWAIVLLVWGVGIVMWVLYFALAVVVLLRIL
jgi:hypothetical protein